MLHQPIELSTAESELLTPLSMLLGISLLVPDGSLPIWVLPKLPVLPPGGDPPFKAF